MRIGSITLLLLSIAIGCEGDEQKPGETGTSSDLPEICVDAPVVTYANFGAGFVTQHCQACHASTTPDRHDAPEAVTFDDEASVMQWADRIVARCLGEDASMPPQGGVSDDDLYLLEVWLTCP